MVLQTLDTELPRFAFLAFMFSLACDLSVSSELATQFLGDAIPELELELVNLLVSQVTVHVAVVYPET